jgi:hypothetical protein
LNSEPPLVTKIRESVNYFILFYFWCECSLGTFAVAEPVPVPNRNRDRFLGFFTEPNRTDINGPVKRLTRTEPKRWFRPYDQPEPVGSDHPINPNPSVPTSRSTRPLRSRPIGYTVHNPTVSPHVSNRSSSSIPSTFPDRCTLSPVSPQTPPLAPARSSRDKQTAYFAQPSVQPSVQPSTQRKYITYIYACTSLMCIYF